MTLIQMTNSVAEGEKTHRHLATCLMLVPQFSSVAPNVMCRHVVPGENELKRDIKNAFHTQEIFPIFDDSAFASVS